MLAVIYIVPYFWLVNLMNVPILVLSTVVGFGAIWSVYGALMGTFLAESFTADVRYTGISLGYQVGAALVGGPMPLIATALVARYHGSYIPVAIFIALCALVSLIAISFTKDRTGQPLDA